MLCGMIIWELLSNLYLLQHWHLLVQHQQVTHLVGDQGEPGGLPSTGLLKSRTRLKRISSSSSFALIEKLISYWYLFFLSLRLKGILLQASLKYPIKVTIFFFLSHCFIMPYLFIFLWLHCMASGILVPGPGVEPGPSAVKAPVPNGWTARKSLMPYLKLKNYEFGFFKLDFFCSS